MREAHEDVEVDGAVGVPGLRCGKDLAEHVAPPAHWPEKRRAHARRLENLPELGNLIRVREDQGALVLRPPARMTQVDGDAQTMLLRREPILGYQEMVLTAIPAYAPQVLGNHGSDQLSKRFDHPFVSFDVSFVI